MPGFSNAGLLHINGKRPFFYSRMLIARRKGIEILCVWEPSTSGVWLYSPIHESRVEAVLTEN